MWKKGHYYKYIILDSFINYCAYVIRYKAILFNFNITFFILKQISNLANS